MWIKPCYTVGHYLRQTCHTSAPWWRNLKLAECAVHIYIYILYVRLVSVVSIYLKQCTAVLGFVVNRQNDIDVDGLL